MRSDQVEELAADIAAAVASAILTSASSLIDPHTARFLSGVASKAATEAARQAVARYTALRIEANTAHVKDLRTR
jgi:CelD/BcsL family acetyltransferase involved in cellulose biosynthesis